MENKASNAIISNKIFYSYFYTKYLLIMLLFAGTLFFTGCFGSIISESNKHNLPKEGVAARQRRDSNKPSFSFIVIGDSRPIDAASPQPRNFLKLIDQIRHEKADFLIHTGDAVVGYTNNFNLYVKQYEDFVKVINKLPFPFHLAPGNHDHMNRTGEKAFKKILKRDSYYAFNHKDSHFIILNTELNRQKGEIAKNQLEWLKEDLRNSRDSKHTFVVMHRPLYSVLNPEGKKGKHLAFTDRRNEYEIRSLMLQYQVDVVFAGHEHLFNKQIHDGVTYIITGPAGSSPYTDILHGGFHHYVKVTVYDDRINISIVKLGGKILDPNSIHQPTTK